MLTTRIRLPARLAPWLLDAPGVRNVLAILLALSGSVWADTVVIAPPPPPPVQIEPAFPVVFQDLSVGYRHEELPQLGLNGFALRAVYGVRGWPVDGEGEMSGAWGHAGTNLVGHAQISGGLRFVGNKPGAVRPFVVVAPVFEATERASSTWSYAVGGNAGAGVDLIFLGPGLVSIDVRGGQTFDLKATEWSGWQVLATVSIGVHEEPRR